MKSMRRRALRQNLVINVAIGVALAMVGVVSVAASGASAMRLSSGAYAGMGPIPSKYTCDGANVSPPLAWSGVPVGARSLALIETDPDAPDPAAPRTTWTHWLLYDLPPTTTGLAENAHSLPAGARFGRNDFGNAAYGGPCPPVGRHRYFIRLYALDVALGDLHAPGRRALEAAMHGHILAQAELVGTCQRQAR